MTLGDGNITGQINKVYQR